MRPAPAYLVEKLDSMLEAADVLKQSGKEFLSAVPKDHKMFEATAQVLNHIYWVNASLKSLGPVNGMVQHVPISDFDCFDVGTPAPPAPPSPPSLPHPAAQPGPSGLQKKRTATAAFGSAEQQEQQSEIVDPVDPEEQQEEEKDDSDGGDEGAGKKKRKFTKELRTGIYTPCNSDCYLEYRCYKVNIKDPRYNTKRGHPLLLYLTHMNAIVAKNVRMTLNWSFISQRTILQTVSGLAISVNMRLSPKTIFGSMSEPNTTTSICISVSSKIAKRVHKVGNMEMMKLLLYGPT